MKNKIGKYISTVFFLGTVIFFMSCGRGEYTGFNAPVGTTITLPAGGSTVIPAGGYVDFITDILVTGPNGGSSSTGPLNDIQMQIGCFQCDIYDKTNGATYIVSDTPLELKQTPYMIKTNSMGFYQIIVRIFSPVDFGLTTMEAQFWANVGFGSTEMKLTTTAPASTKLDIP